MMTKDVRQNIAEVSFVFRGKDALENSEAFILYLSTVDGVWSMMEGIRHFGGLITYIHEDADQKMLLLDGDMSDEKNDA